MQIFRVQDREGRGPFKPGMTLKWLDKNKDISQLPAGQEFADLYSGLDRKKLHYAFGCDTLDQLMKWFSLAELSKLRGLGYQVVKMRADEIIATSKTQLLFGRKKHLAAHCKIVEI